MGLDWESVGLMIFHTMRPTTHHCTSIRNKITAQFLRITTLITYSVRFSVEVSETELFYSMVAWEVESHLPHTRKVTKMYKDAD